MTGQTGSHDSLEIYCIDCKKNLYRIIQKGSTLFWDQEPEDIVHDLGRGYFLLCPSPQAEETVMLFSVKHTEVKL